MCTQGFPEAAAQALGDGLRESKGRAVVLTRALMEMTQSRPTCLHRGKIGCDPQREIRALEHRYHRGAIIPAGIRDDGTTVSRQPTSRGASGPLCWDHPARAREDKSSISAIARLPKMCPVPQRDEWSWDSVTRT
ncbi:hypothetical protein AAFF_G00269900 [Aldrovandia affinis]|uniref:Uncharacterized protein n=1 Tax=Aldrovandia affinis TaxID=143900 RepID=A0AAD7SUA9_9TELE|nr:hypothetical protein AAFF_G00269900 [Aldrovandia affinis]